MNVAAISFGVGSLLVSAALKATPEEYLAKIPFSLNEDAIDDGNDILSRVSANLQGKAKRSETERLLDSMK